MSGLVSVFPDKPMTPETKTSVLRKINEILNSIAVRVTVIVIGTVKYRLKVV
jgi:hypothetical protein